jgi:hypothetical protein
MYFSRCPSVAQWEIMAATNFFFLFFLLLIFRLFNINWRVDSFILAAVSSIVLGADGFGLIRPYSNRTSESIR